MPPRAGLEAAPSRTGRSFEASAKPEVHSLFLLEVEKPVVTYASKYK